MLCREAEDRAHDETRADAALMHARIRAREQFSRGKWVDAINEREKWRTVDFYVGGTMMEVAKEPGYEMYEDAERGVRGRVEGFSRRSRQRMMEAGAKLLSKVLPVMLTVTYGREWPSEPEVWKQHLNSLWKRIERKFKGVSGMWKLEPQKRGAPHFHLLVWGESRIDWQWLAVAWAEIIHGVELPGDYPVAPFAVGAKWFRQWAEALDVGAEVKLSLAAGVRAEAVRSKRGVKAYLSKKYMGKEVELPGDWKNPGRMWGIKGRACLPRAERVRWEISKGAAFKLRRLIRRSLNRRAMGGRNLGRVVLYADATLDWARAVAWAQGFTDFPPRGAGVPLEATPF